MRSAVIVFLFLFSMLFLGAQAAQLGAPEPAEDAAAKPAQHANAGPLQPVGHTVEPAD